MMEILVLSSLSADTGSAIRAQLIAENLQKAGAKVKFVKPLPQTLPLKLDLLISLPWYFWQVFVSSAKFILAVKSCPNVGLPLLFKKLWGTKIIIDTDDLSFAYTQGPWSKISKFLQEIFLPLADLHTYHNAKIKNYLIKDLKISPSKTFYLKQGVDLEIFQKGQFKNPQELKNRLGLQNKKILTFVGHFDVACDLESILRSLPKVFNTNAQARLVLIGDGERKKYFFNLAKTLGISDKIIWTGIVSQREVAEILNVSDICLVYYKNKLANLFRSSLKIREYLGLGKQVVCNNVGELREFKDYTYQTSSRLSDFAGMIIKVLQGFGDKREIKGRNFIRKKYSWAEISQDLSRKLKNV